MSRLLVPCAILDENVVARSVGMVARTSPHHHSRAVLPEMATHLPCHL